MYKIRFESLKVARSITDFAVRAGWNYLYRGDIANYEYPKEIYFNPERKHIYNTVSSTNWESTTVEDLIKNLSPTRPNQFKYGNKTFTIDRQSKRVRIGASSDEVATFKEVEDLKKFKDDMASNCIIVATPTSFDFWLVRSVAVGSGYLVKGEDYHYGHIYLNLTTKEMSLEKPSANSPAIHFNVSSQFWAKSIFEGRIIPKDLPGINGYEPTVFVQGNSISLGCVTISFDEFDQLVKELE